jgi:hypothetical protein
LTRSVAHNRGSPSVPRLVKGKKPKVAEQAQERAGAKISLGIEKLNAVQEPREAARLISEEGWPTSVDGFLRWARIGNDTLYKTRPDQIPDVKSAVTKFQKLAQSKPKAPRREIELASLRQRVHDLEFLLQRLTQDLLNVSSDRDDLRMDHAYEFARADREQHRADIYAACLRQSGIAVPVITEEAPPPRIRSTGDRRRSLANNPKLRLRDGL